MNRNEKKIFKKREVNEKRIKLKNIKRKLENEKDFTRMRKL